MAGLPSAKYSKILVGVLISVNALRWLGITPTSHASIAGTSSSSGLGPK